MLWEFLVWCKRKTFTFNFNEPFIFLYKTYYVRPLLEYCVQLWCLYLDGDIDTQERVQKEPQNFSQNFLNLHMNLDSENWIFTDSTAEENVGILLRCTNCLRDITVLTGQNFLPLLLCTKKENWNFARNLLDFS